MVESEKFRLRDWISPVVIPAALVLIVAAFALLQWLR
jgi:hypothetical protein